MLGKDAKKINSLEFERILKDENITSIEQFKKYLYPYEEFSDVVLTHRWYDKPKSTLTNRLNMLWVYPVFIICIPFRFVVYGHFHVNPNTKLSEILKKLLGEY